VGEQRGTYTGPLPFVNDEGFEIQVTNEKTGEVYGIRLTDAMIVGVLHSLETHHGSLDKMPTEKAAKLFSEAALERMLATVRVVPPSCPEKGGADA